MDPENKSQFRDFIPAEEENSAYTVDGYQDFVPAPEPQLQNVEESPAQEETLVAGETPVATPEVPADEDLITADQLVADEPQEPEFVANPDGVVAPEATQWDSQQLDADTPVTEQGNG